MCVGSASLQSLQLTSEIGASHCKHIIIVWKIADCHICNTLLVSYKLCLSQICCSACSCYFIHLGCYANSITVYIIKKNSLVPKQVNKSIHD